MRIGAVTPNQNNQTNLNSLTFKGIVEQEVFSKGLKDSYVRRVRTTNKRDIKILGALVGLQGIRIGEKTECIALLNDAKTALLVCLTKGREIIVKPTFRNEHKFLPKGTFRWSLDISQASEDVQKELQEKVYPHFKCTV